MRGRARLRREDGRSMTEPGVFGVLTGDLKASSDLDAATLEFARGEVAAAVDAVAVGRSDAVAGGPEFFRGDSWQLALRDAGLALRIAVLARARLRTRAQTDTRIGIGVGAVERLHPERVSLSTGEAFVLSGRALDAIGPRDPDLAIALPATLSSLEGWVNATLAFCDDAVSDWSQTGGAEVSGEWRLAGSAHRRRDLRGHTLVRRRRRRTRCGAWRLGASITTFFGCYLYLQPISVVFCDNSRIRLFSRQQAQSAAGAS
jgi:hypothetical protein